MVRMHFAHITLRTFRPPTNTETRCRFGRNVRFVARMEKLRLCPNVVVLPQDSHLAIAKILSNTYDYTICPEKYLALLSTKKNSTTSRIFLQEIRF